VAEETFVGKRALVTGGARGLGRTFAVALGYAGYSVGITYRSSPEEADRTLSEIADAGAVNVGVRCDLRDPDAVSAAVNEIATDLGGIDLLVNNAGLFETAALEEISTEQWDAMFETNTRAPFLVAKAAHPYLKAARGRIVNIGSLGGMHPWVTHAHYCTSKAALHMLSQTMAKAWAPEISVNCIAPGMIVKTDTPDPAYQHFADKTPMRRNGTAEDVVEALLFFATGPHFITGQLLAVDGGLGL
jgi:NAD(P)-dependent dehydrogenase (short-subunit alcohol dehydrogenase family)